MHAENVEVLKLLKRFEIFEWHAYHDPSGFSVLSFTRTGGGASQLDRELSRLTTEAEHAAAQLGETRERLVTAEARTSELHFATRSDE